MFLPREKAYLWKQRRLGSWWRMPRLTAAIKIPLATPFCKCNCETAFMPPPTSGFSVCRLYKNTVRNTETPPTATGGISPPWPPYFSFNQTAALGPTVVISLASSLLWVFLHLSAFCWIIAGATVRWGSKQAFSNLREVCTQVIGLCQHSVIWPCLLQILSFNYTNGTIPNCIPWSSSAYFHEQWRWNKQFL